MTIKTILVGFDFSETARHALEQGIVLAETFGAKLEIFYTLASPLPGYEDLKPLRGQVLQKLEERVSQEIDRIQTPHAKEKLDWNCDVSDGKPYREMAEKAAKISADLIIVGTHGYSGFERVFLGSVSENVIRQAPCSILVHRHTKTKGFKRILVPIDIDEYSFKGVQMAAQWAQTFSGELILIHAIDLRTYMPVSEMGLEVALEKKPDDISKVQDQKFNDFIKRLKAEIPLLGSIKWRSESHVGFPIPTILEACEDHDRDLIIMGSHGGKINKIFLGSVAENVTRYAKVSVLVVR